jgi:hypothetical protein
VPSEAFQLAGPEVDLAKHLRAEKDEGSAVRKENAMAFIGLE